MSAGHNPFLPTNDTGFGGGGFGGLPNSYAPPVTKKPLLESDDESGDDDVTDTPLLGTEIKSNPPVSNPFLPGGATGLASLSSTMKSSSSSASVSERTASGGSGGATIPTTTGASDGTPKNQTKKTGWIFSLNFYQQFFDVDTSDVLARARSASLTPWQSVWTDSHEVDTNPDLYGPFWTCATLVFLIATGGEFSKFLSQTDETKRQQWNFDIHAVASSTAVMFGYVFVVPILAYLALRCVGGNPGGNVPGGLARIICTYGYSLVVFVPASLLSIWPNEAFTWAVFLCAASAGALFLLNNVARPLSRDAKAGVAFQTPFVGAVVGAHVLFGVVVKLWFFTRF